MTRKHLTVSEPLAIFEDLSSGDDSDRSEKDNDDEECNCLNTENILSSSDESDANYLDCDEDISSPGPSQSVIPEWKERGVATNIPQFVEYAGPSMELLKLDDFSPVHIFFCLFTHTFAKSNVFQTNLYATQKGQCFAPTAVPEIFVFLRINLLMGIKGLPSYHH